MPDALHTVLDEPTWRERMAAHEARLAPVLDPYLNARARGAKDPVMDFLFEYYPFRPAQLRRWSPGFGVALAGDAAAFLDQPGFAETPVGVALVPERFPAKRVAGTRWIRDLLAATAARTPHYGCSGLHEWAMVYRTDRVRHGQVPLRLSDEAIADLLASRPLTCTHYDAFRFFTPAARPLNRHQPEQPDMPALEQPGCLHTNMDVYRWAFKRAPWIGSDLLADAFLLACRAREVDMRASPYDLRDRGLAPIRVETPEGRKAYAQAQQAIAEAAAPLRARLLAAYDHLLEGVEARAEDDTHTV